MKAWGATLLGLALGLTLAYPALAQLPPDPVRSPAQLQQLFPSTTQLPAGMVLADAGSHNADQIAATFPDPQDAAQVLATWGWVGSAYEVYVAGPGAGPDTPAQLEISLHQFSTNTGAAYALPYYAHARAVLAQQTEGPVTQLRPCEAAVSGASDVSRYVRDGDLLIRVTATMPDAARANAAYLALSVATDVAFAVLGNAGSSARELDQTCH
jgi:hypothetical protein